MIFAKPYGCETERHFRIGFTFDIQRRGGTTLHADVALGAEILCHRRSEGSARSVSTAIKSTRWSQTRMNDQVVAGQNTQSGRQGRVTQRDVGDAQRVLRAYFQRIERETLMARALTLSPKTRNLVIGRPREFH